MTRRVSLSKNRISRDSAAILELFLEFLFFWSGIFASIFGTQRKKINASFQVFKK
jgi:hypothetical protein